MDLNDLNNKQMILLTMFVAFVCSIGTGILTAAMLREGPQTVTQTVNRVVERTIERVVTGTSTPEKIAPAPVQTITKEVTVYAKEDDLVVAAVEKNQPLVVRIYNVGTATATIPIAIGFVVSRDGIVVSDARSLAGDSGLKANYAVAVGDTTYAAKLVKPEGFESRPVQFLTLTDLPKDKTLDAVTFPSKLDPKVAQTVVILGGEDGASIFKTSLAKFKYSKGQGTTTPSYLVGIETTPRIPDGNAGALVVNLDGQALGIAVWDEASAKYVIFPMSRVVEYVKTLAAKLDPNETAAVPGAANAAAVVVSAPPAS